mmetsp:Transcript_43985/g.44475  ORF Transcript_43985/g.44475 Transcript_43985/m.44475 type:complete len:87 (+) Transcript_43985:873-1133(+)
MVRRGTCREENGGWSRPSCGDRIPWRTAARRKKMAIDNRRKHAVVWKDGRAMIGDLETLSRIWTFVWSSPTLREINFAYDTLCTNS